LHAFGIVPGSTLSELRSKYEEMLALRRLKEPADPRPRLAALASRFPGALREIDDLPLHEIERRIAALAAAEREPASAPPWMHAMTRFHALARGVLFVKARGAHPGDDWPEEARLWRDDLARIARPPRGRLMDLVYERLARELGTTPAAAKRLVFGERRRPG
jgi:hypothetical protein